MQYNGLLLKLIQLKIWRDEPHAVKATNRRDSNCDVIITALNHLVSDRAGVDNSVIEITVNYQLRWSWELCLRVNLGAKKALPHYIFLLSLHTLNPHDLIQYIFKIIGAFLYHTTFTFLNLKIIFTINHFFLNEARQGIV